MELQKLTFIEVPAMADQIVRPYDTDISPGLLKDASDLLQGGTRLSHVSLAKVASGLIRPTGRAFRASIDKGWDIPRIRFAMVACIDDSGWSKEYAYITGYTDIADYTSHGTKIRFDPNMRMYFDSITKVGIAESHYRGGRIYQPRLNAHDQVLSRSVFSGSSNDRGLLRPVDLFRRKELSNADTPAHWSAQGSTFTSKVGSFNAPLMANNRLNNSPTGFLERSLRAYVGSSETASDPFSGWDESDSQKDILAGAVDRVEENVLALDPLLDDLKRRTNYLRQGYITFGDLVDMNPDFDFDQHHGFKQLKSMERGRYRDTMAAGTGGVEGTAANILAQSLPTLLINAMWSGVDDLIINTRAPYGQPQVIVSKAWPFMEGISVSARYDYFVDQMEHVVVKDMSHNGRLDIEATVHARVDGMVEIFICVDGDEEAHFVFPAFASGLIVPTLAEDLEIVDRVSDDICRLANHLTTGRAEVNPDHILPELFKPGSIGGNDAERSSTTRKDRSKERSW